MSNQSPGGVGPKSNPPPVSGTSDTTTTDVVQARTSENPLGLNTSGLALSGQVSENVTSTKDNNELTVRLDAVNRVAEGKLKCPSPQVASTMTGLINVCSKGNSASFTAIAGGDPKQGFVVVKPPGSERLGHDDEKIIEDNKILWETILKDQVSLQEYVDAMGGFVTPNAVPLCVGVPYGQRAMHLKDHFILGRCTPLDTRAVRSKVTWLGTPIHDTLENIQSFGVHKNDVGLVSVLMLLKYLRLKNILIMDADSYCQSIENIEREFLYTTVWRKRNLRFWLLKNVKIVRLLFTTV